MSRALVLMGLARAGLVIGLASWPAPVHACEPHQCPRAVHPAPDAGPQAMDTQWAILFSMEAHATPATITLRAGDGGIRPASVTWEPRDELNTRQEPAVALVRLATPFRGQLHMELSGKLSWTDAGCALAAQYELVESTTLGPPPSYPADSLSIASRLTPDNELTWCPGTVTRVQHFVTGPGSRVR